MVMTDQLNYFYLEEVNKDIYGKTVFWEIAGNFRILIDTSS